MSPLGTENEYVTVAEAAAFVGCAEKTIRRRIADGSIPGYRLGPRMIRVRLSEVTAALRPVPSGGWIG